jgi:phosphohistidine phosphatase
MRTLLVMRHAKSDWSADHAGDHARPLNERGARSARAIGEVLTARGLAPDLVVTSSAVRAFTTAELAAEAGGWTCGIEVEPLLYSAISSQVIERAANAPAVERVMLVGHQPTWSAVVADLTGQDVDMKTAAVAVIEVPIEVWSDLPSAPTADLVEVIQSRDHI